MNQESEKKTKSKHSLLNKGDWIILLIVFCVLMVLLFFVSNRKQGDLVHITVNGQMMTYSMWENRRISVTEDGNITENTVESKDTVVMNCIVIKNGQVYMESAVCPDQICVRHGSISKNREMIICLPNKVFIEVESNKENEIDN